MKTCEICDKRAIARNLCRKHYQSAWRNGSIDDHKKTRPPLLERLLSRFKRDTNGCWLWTGTINDAGYGMIWLDGESVDRAHRVAYRLLVGEIPDGLAICHSCDVRRCINPSHLFLGTRAENNKDMADKGRAERGQDHHAAKLSDKDVLKIRSIDESIRAIAKSFGINRNTVWKIKNRRSWRHL